ncbi:PEP/pyruvate-binding domain-containing protein [Streptomyces nigra]|uniref:PEP/pyruvate-binding domain-containing protein n=1 Tax=Streptomyces nigra TaxID=1827580 RepID=UPI001FC9CB8A|nr:PEP/pyruvate-binding domain-containing protein [Streptomyces nigra]
MPLSRAGSALALTGSKAANLARAAAAGLPVLPGFVIPHGAREDEVALRRAWDELSDGGARPLVVRSSSPQEDTEESSLAGRFASVLDVRGWASFRAAVRTVQDSARLSDGSTAPMAVLVQPMLGARVGGVLFGADPVAGRADRMLVSAVPGGPDSLVGGTRASTDHWLSRRGRLIRVLAAEDPPEEPAAPRSWASEDLLADSSGEPSHRPGSAGDGALLTRGELFRLARLARRAERVFGAPQDIEFGFDADGRLWLFQSRPITAMAARPARGARLLGPGPVAETLPDQLTPLEEDLWVAPMARGLAAALDIGGTAPRRVLRSMPVVTTVGGRAAADLRLLGTVPPRHRWLALLNPAPGARRLTAAWRMGRLTAALPGLARDVVADVDSHLAEIPPPSTLAGTELAAELRWSRRVLVSLHAQEALAGALLREPPGGRTAAGVALAALDRARARGVPDSRVIATDPVVLALTAPSLREPRALPEPTLLPARSRQPQPPAAMETAAGTPSAGPASLPPREALRLRVRWVQELQVRLVREVAERLGIGPDRVALLRWPELTAVLEGGALPADLPARVPPPATPALPDAFRLTGDGQVVVERGSGGDGGARGVSAGRALGTVWAGTAPRPSDAVLVVRTLDPALAPLLPGLTGLVAQTGSALSHLAVLAREFGIPTVVGVTDAVRRFPPGSRIVVDGTAGDVRLGEPIGQGEALRQGEDVQATPDVRAAQDVRAGRDVREGEDVRGGEGVRAGQHIRAGRKARAGGDLRPGGAS